MVDRIRTRNWFPRRDSEDRRSSDIGQRPNTYKPPKDIDAYNKALLAWVAEHKPDDNRGYGYYGSYHRDGDSPRDDFRGEALAAVDFYDRDIEPGEIALNGVPRIVGGRFVEVDIPYTRPDRAIPADVEVTQD